MDPKELEALHDRCTRFLNWHGRQPAAALLADIPVDTVPDRYGQGGVVEALEGEVAGLLGKPAAVFMPSGTMAQQATLRVHSDRRTSRVVLSTRRATSICTRPAPTGAYSTWSAGR